MLCRRHHRAVHEEGYQVDRDADGECGSGGRTVASYLTSRRRPRRRAIPWIISERGPVGRIATVLPAYRDAGWRGERLDVVWAIDVLHPLAAGR